MIGYDSSSLVIDNWCDEALGGGRCRYVFLPWLFCFEEAVTGEYAQLPTETAA